MHHQCKGADFLGESELRQGGPLVHMLETDGTQLRNFGQLLHAIFFQFFAGHIGVSEFSRRDNSGPNRRFFRIFFSCPNRLS